MNVKLNDNQKIDKINCANKVFGIMHSVLMRESKIRRSQEHFWIVGLNYTNNILFVELISLGADNKVMISPRELFRFALKKFAHSIILVHNHPSGTNTPSNTDNDFTDHYVKLGEFLNVHVLDHIIITESNGFYSYAEMGKLKSYNLSKELDEFDFQQERENLIYNHFKQKIQQEIISDIASEFIKTKTPVKRISEITGIQKNILLQMKRELIIC